MPSVHGEFEISSWDEQTYEKGDDERKLTEAQVTQSFSGDIAGSGSVRWLMSYQPDGTAHFVGLQHIDAKLGGEPGTVVLETIGDFDGKVAKGVWTVVPASGTGAFAEMLGDGDFEAPMGDTLTYRLAYSRS